MDTTVWLVDVGYVVKASEGIFRLDYVETDKFLHERCGPVRAFLFNGYDNAYGIPPGLQGFYDAMTQYGMTVRLQPMGSDTPGTNRQRRVDVDLSAHLVWQASLEGIQSLVLTTGDQDLVPAVEIVREQYGKRVILLTYRRNVHRELIELANEWWLFEDQEERLARW